jgi:hypothetical protein
MSRASLILPVVAAVLCAVIAGAGARRSVGHAAGARAAPLAEQAARAIPARPPGAHRRADREGVRHALAAWAAAARVPRPTGSLLVNVYDATGVPVMGVKLTAEPEDGRSDAQRAYTDEEGMALFPRLPAGAYTLVARAPRMVGQELPRVVAEGERAEAALILDSEPDPP